MNLKLLFTSRSRPIRWSRTPPKANSWGSDWRFYQMYFFLFISVDVNKIATAKKKKIVGSESKFHRRRAHHWHLIGRHSASIFGRQQQKPITKLSELIKETTTAKRGEKKMRHSEKSWNFHQPTECAQRFMDVAANWNWKKRFKVQQKKRNIRRVHRYGEVRHNYDRSQSAVLLSQRMNG